MYRDVVLWVTLIAKYLVLYLTILLLSKAEIHVFLKLWDRSVSNHKLSSQHWFWLSEEFSISEHVFSLVFSILLIFTRFLQELAFSICWLLLKYSIMRSSTSRVHSWTALPTENIYPWCTVWTVAIGHQKWPAFLSSHCRQTTD